MEQARRELAKGLEERAEMEQARRELARGLEEQAEIEQARRALAQALGERAEARRQALEGGDIPVERPPDIVPPERLLELSRNIAEAFRDGGTEAPDERTDPHTTGSIPGGPNDPAALMAQARRELAAALRQRAEELQGLNRNSAPPAPSPAAGLPGPAAPPAPPTVAALPELPPEIPPPQAQPDLAPPLIEKKPSPRPAPVAALPPEIPPPQAQPDLTPPSTEKKPPTVAALPELPPAPVPPQAHPDLMPPPINKKPSLPIDRKPAAALPPDRPQEIRLPVDHAPEAPKAPSRHRTRETPATGPKPALRQGRVASREDAKELPRPAKRILPPRREEAPAAKRHGPAKTARHEAPAPAPVERTPPRVPRRDDRTIPTIPLPAALRPTLPLAGSPL
jgi:hypothetical protein